MGDLQATTALNGTPYPFAAFNDRTPVLVVVRSGARGLKERQLPPERHRGWASRDSLDGPRTSVTPSAMVRKAQAFLEGSSPPPSHPMRCPALSLAPPSPHTMTRAPCREAAKSCTSIPFLLALCQTAASAREHATSARFAGNCTEHLFCRRGHWGCWVRGLGLGLGRG